MNAAAAEPEESDYHESVHVSSDAHEGAADDASVGSAERIAGNNIVDDGVREQLGNNPRVNINGVVEQPRFYYQLFAVTWWLIAAFYNALPERVRNLIRQPFPAQPVWVFAAEHIATAFNCSVKDIPRNVTPQQVFARGVRPLRLCGSKQFGDNSVCTVVGGSTTLVCTVTHRSGCVLHRPLMGTNSRTLMGSSYDDAVFVLVRHNPQGHWGERFRTPEDITQVNECGSDLVSGAGGVTLLKAYLLKLDHANISLIYDITGGGEHLIDINTRAQAITFFGCQTLARELDQLHRRANGTKEFGGNPPRTAHLFKAKSLPFATKPSDYQVVGDAAQRKNTLLTTYNSETYVNARDANSSGNRLGTGGSDKACMVFDVAENRDIAKFASVKKAFSNEGRTATGLKGRPTHTDVQEATDADSRGYFVKKGGKKGLYVRIITDEKYKKKDPNILDPLGK